jgi:hypothetical protein
VTWARIFDPLTLLFHASGWLLSPESLTVTAGAPGSYTIQLDLRTSTGVQLPLVVLYVAVQP